MNALLCCVLLLLTGCATSADRTADSQRFVHRVLGLRRLNGKPVCENGAAMSYDCDTGGRGTACAHAGYRRARTTVM